MREAANQHNIFIRTRIRRFAIICWPLRICQLRTMAGRTSGSSGKPRCGHLLTEPRNPSGVCQMMRSRYLVLCGSEITKPRVCSSSTALAGQMTVPLGGNHRSCTSRHTARPACRGGGQSPPFCTRASIAPVTLVARRGANLSPAPCRRVSAHF